MSVSTQVCRERFRVHRALALEALRSIAALPALPDRWQELRTLATATGMAGLNGDRGAAPKAIATSIDAFCAAAQNAVLERMVQLLNIQFAV